MYDITISDNGIIKKINIEAKDSYMVQKIITNMYGKENIVIINIVRR